MIWVLVIRVRQVMDITIDSLCASPLAKLFNLLAPYLQGYPSEKVALRIGYHAILTDYNGRHVATYTGRDCGNAGVIGDPVGRDILILAGQNEGHTAMILNEIRSDVVIVIN